MPGHEPKGQHYVHRAYLEGFQDPDLERKGESFVWVYLPGKSPFRQRPERVARRNYYYCYDNQDKREFRVEYDLAKLEDAALPILRRLRQRQFGLQTDDRTTFAGYIALTHTRVPVFERAIDRLSSLVTAKQLELLTKNRRRLESVVEMIKKDSGEIIDPEEFQNKLMGGSVELVQTNRGWSIRQMFSVMMELQQVIFEMNWTYLLAPEGSEGFLTTDNPVSPFDPIGEKSGVVGFASSPAAHFIFPLSRDICLFAQHRRGSESHKLKGFEVRSVNRRMISRADSQLYASFKSPSVQRILDSVAAKKTATGKILLSKGRVLEK
jgi:hypothetical protein